MSRTTDNISALKKRFIYQRSINRAIFCMNYSVLNPLALSRGKELKNDFIDLMWEEKKCSYVSSSCFLTRVTLAPSRETENPPTSVGMVFSFCAFFSATISSARNSTNSFSAMTKRGKVHACPMWINYGGFRSQYIEIVNDNARDMK